MATLPPSSLAPRAATLRATTGGLVALTRVLGRVDTCRAVDSLPARDYRRASSSTGAFQLREVTLGRLMHHIHGGIASL